MDGTNGCTKRLHKKLGPPVYGGPCSFWDISGARKSAAPNFDHAQTRPFQGTMAFSAIRIRISMPKPITPIRMIPINTMSVS
jgi:hypothetical protein